MPRIVKPLTDASLRNAKPRNKSYKLADGGGLYLEVMPGGGKSWRMKFRFGGLEKRLSFGLWPAISLQDARRLRDEAKATLAQGIDPGEKRKQDRAESAATLDAVAREWHAKQSQVWSPGHGESIMARLEKHVFPACGQRPVNSLTAPAILPILQGLEDSGKSETAHRIRQYLEAVFVFAIATGRAERNAAADLRKALAPRRATHRAALTTADGFARVVRACWSYTGQPTTATGLKLLALTACRPGEVRAMEWAEINMDASSGPTWIVPADRAKMRRDHVVPLSRQAVELLKAMHALTGEGRYVFPAIGKGVKPLSEAAFNQALRRLGFSKEEMCAHGFRASFSTLAREMGHAHHLVEACLAHVQGNSVSRAYDRALYLPERRKLLQAWADYVDALRKGGRVVPMYREAVEA